MVQVVTKYNVLYTFFMRRLIIMWCHCRFLFQSRETTALYILYSLLSILKLGAFFRHIKLTSKKLNVLQTAHRTYQREVPLF